MERRLRAIGDDIRLAAKYTLNNCDYKQMFTFFFQIRACRCYDVSDEKSYLVFEDLTPAGYATVDRRIGLDVKHFEKVVEKLAKWHAVTAVLVQEVRCG